MIRRIGRIAAASLIMAAGLATAAEDLGVKIYPGAEKDEHWSKVQAEAREGLLRRHRCLLSFQGPGGKSGRVLPEERVHAIDGHVTPDGADAAEWREAQHDDREHEAVGQHERYAVLHREEGVSSRKAFRRLRPMVKPECALRDRTKRCALNKKLHRTTDAKCSLHCFFSSSIAPWRQNSSVVSGLPLHPREYVANSVLFSDFPPLTSSADGHALDQACQAMIFSFFTHGILSA